MTQSACDVSRELSSVSSCKGVRGGGRLQDVVKGNAVAIGAEEITCVWRMPRLFQAREIVDTRETASVVALLNELFEKLREEAVGPLRGEGGGADDNRLGFGRIKRC